MENTVSKQSSLPQQATGAQCATSGRKSSAHSRRLTRFKSAGIVTAYRDPSLKVADIAERFNVSQATVLIHAKAAGVPSRHKSTKKVSESEAQVIMQLRKNGLSQDKIAKAVGRTTETVRKVLKRGRQDVNQAQLKVEMIEPPTLWQRIKRFFGG